MAWNPVPVDLLEAEPSDVRHLADDLRALGARLLGCGAVLRAGSAVPADSFDGVAGDRFRSTCLLQREVALATALELEALGGAADELSRDLDDLRVLLQQLRGIAHGGGLEVGAAAVWPPHPTERHEDTAALRAAWSAYDRCWTLRETLETRRDAAERAWRTALLGATADVDPSPSGEAAGRVAGALGPRPGHAWTSSRAHWQPVGPEGHGSRAAEVTRVDGRWEPVVPAQRPPSVA
ncbi:hypothetical protein [uncultured Nocardioides sp.]|uniref:hypothetical protein n=1 Tax=uncultured Nocardioides sp. TaxID=198441 RepID=UPI0025D0F5A7|nr:hypothetical protein [uncultured Nocardioides sp.]